MNGSELNELRDFLQSTLPPAALTFAYGSGVVNQCNERSVLDAKMTLSPLAAKPMIDVVLAVHDPHAWHATNLSCNPCHYSGAARAFGSRIVTAVQERFGGRLYYNTLIPIELGQHQGRYLKYGVISSKHLRQDLTGWEWLYASGRLQKPVKFLSGKELFAEEINMNLKLAVCASLLLLPESFSMHSLLYKVAELSYGGDIRVGVAEDPYKVKNLVNGAMEAFQSLYAPVLQAVPGISMTSIDGSLIAQDYSTKHRMSIVSGLPLVLQRGLSSAGHSHYDMVAAPLELQRIIAGIVRRSSIGQTFKGLLTAGMLKSFTYAGAKIAKAGWRRPM